MCLVYGLGMRVWGLGFKSRGLESPVFVEGPGFRLEGLGFRV